MLEEGATHIVKYEFRNDEPDIIHERGYAYNLNYHIVWCTKYRNQALANPNYTEEQLNRLLGVPDQWKNVAYARVSSQGQKKI